MLSRSETFRWGKSSNDFIQQNCRMKLQLSPITGAFLPVEWIGTTQPEAMFEECLCTLQNVLIPQRWHTHALMTIDQQCCCLMLWKMGVLLALMFLGFLVNPSLWSWHQFKPLWINFAWMHFSPLYLYSFCFIWYYFIITLQKVEALCWKISWAKPSSCLQGHFNILSVDHFISSQFDWGLG